MTLAQLIVLALQASIVMTVFGFGLQATLADILYVTRRPALLVRSLASMYLVMPLVAIALVRLLELRPSVEIAMIALALSPTPPLLPAKAGKSGGLSSYTLGVMAIGALASIAIVPVGLPIVGRYSGQPFHLPPGTLAQMVLVSILLPLAVGMAVKAFMPAIGNRLAAPVALAAKVVLAAGVVALVAAAVPDMLSLIGNGTIFAIVAFVAAGLAVGHLLGGPQSDEQIVLALSTANRHPAIALAIAKVNFPDEPALGATVILFLLVGALVAAPYLKWQGRRIQSLSVER